MQSTTTTTNPQFRFYFMSENVTFDEDHHHEFKGHRSISEAEINHKLRTRQSVSKALNGFLNSNDGGCVYLGITDDGIARGIMLTDSQKDHIELELDDLMADFVPPVTSDRYKIEFVPVISKGTNDPQAFIEKLEKMRESEYELEQRHRIKTSEMCWCDMEARALLGNNTIITTYIVEIYLFKFEVPPIKMENLENLPFDYIEYFHPIFEAENNVCYFRHEASLNKYSAPEIYTIATDEAEAFCSNVIHKLKMEKKRLMEMKK